MKSPKVRIYIRIRLLGKDAYAAPVVNKNGSLRESYALVQGHVTHHPEGVYYLRYAFPDGKRRWEAVGRFADAAIVAQRNTEHALRGAALGPRCRAGSEAQASALLPSNGSEYPAGDNSTSASLSVADAIDSYLTSVRQFRAAKTIAAYTNILSSFRASCGELQLGALTREHLLDHVSGLKARGLSDRTLFNHLAQVTAFLKSQGIADLVTSYDKPRYDEKLVSAYGEDELRRLLAGSTNEMKLLWVFFLFTGFRDGEVMHCTWADVDFEGRNICVRSKPRSGFRPKDREERFVPVPDELIDALRKRQGHSRTALIFPTAGGKPNQHMLRTLQATALRAGLNCSECVNKAGKSCANHPVCHRWGLHKFRKTFATRHAEAGVSAPTIQSWLGHSSLETTLRYLAIADARSVRTREQVNRSFNAISLGETV